MSRSGQNSTLKEIFLLWFFFYSFLRVHLKDYFLNKKSYIVLRKLFEEKSFKTNLKAQFSIIETLNLQRVIPQDNNHFGSNEKVLLSKTSSHKVKVKEGCGYS